MFTSIMLFFQGIPFNLNQVLSVKSDMMDFFRRSTHFLRLRDNYVKDWTSFKLGMLIGLKQVAIRSQFHGRQLNIFDSDFQSGECQHDCFQRLC